MTFSSDTDNSFNQQFILLAVAVGIVNTGFGIIFPIFPKMLTIIGGGDAFDLGVLVAAFGAAYLVGSPLFGNIADRIGMKKVILIGLLGFSFSNFIYILATNMAHLYIARIIEGFFAAAILPPAIALTTKLSPKENRGRYLGLLGASQTAGIIVGPLLGGVLFDGFEIGTITVTGSLDLPFYASAFFGFLAFFWSYIKLPETSLAKPRILNPETTQTDTSGNSIKYRIRNVLGHQIRVLPKPLYMFMLFVIGEMLSILAWLTIEPGFVLYFYDDLLLSATDFGIFVATFAVVSVIGQALLGNVSDKVGRKPVLIIGQMFSFLFYFSLLRARTLMELSLAVIWVGIGSGLRDPAMKAWLSDLTEEENRGTVFGIESGLMSISQIIGPIIGGYLYVREGMQFIFWIAIVINVVNILVLSTLKFEAIDEAKIIDLSDPEPIYSTGN